MHRWLLTCAIALVSMAAPGEAEAQGALVHGSVAAAVSDGSTSPTFGGGVAYRFNRALGFGVELTHIRDYASDNPYRFCCGENEGRVTTFTSNVRLEIPTTLSRVVPFVVGGGGVAGITRSYSVVYAGLENLDILTPAEIAGLRGAILPGPPTLEYTTTSMALTLGGGASVLITDHVTVDVDMRVLRLTGDVSKNLGRFGVGASYRF